MINVSVDIGSKFAAYGNVFDRRDPARNRPAISIDDMFARKQQRVTEPVRFSKFQAQSERRGAKIYLGKDGGDHFHVTGVEDDAGAVDVREAYDALPLNSLPHLSPDHWMLTRAGSA
jgi:hypothetical protein